MYDTEVELLLYTADMAVMVTFVLQVIRTKKRARIRSMLSGHLPRWSSRESEFGW
jgi:hypothetical protein